MNERSKFPLAAFLVSVALVTQAALRLVAIDHSWKTAILVLSYGLQGIGGLLAIVSLMKRKPAKGDNGT